MRQTLPFREFLLSEPDSSLSRVNRRLDKSIPFLWHHHPEYELTLTLNSRGQRFIGDHVGSYDDGDLVLVGPNLPHTWYSQSKVSKKGPHVALVIWFHPELAERITDSFVEFEGIQRMLKRAGRGLLFSRKTSRVVRSRFELLFSCPPAERFLTFLSVLHQLASSDTQLLSNTSSLLETPLESRNRIDRVLTYVHAHYKEPLSLEELASVAALSESGLHRLFVKHTGKTISSYLKNMRIGDACARLSGTTQQINYIADAVGYTSLANFNRHFLATKGMTPREYRRLFILPASRRTNHFATEALLA
jgi:AraC-like DNA-binding protein